MMIGIGMHVRESDASHTPDRVGKSFDYVPIASLAHVGDAFENWMRHAAMIPRRVTLTLLDPPPILRTYADAPRGKIAS